MPKRTILSHPNGRPALTEEITEPGTPQQHTIREKLDEEGKLLERTDTYREGSTVVQKTETFNPPGKVEKTVVDRTTPTTDGYKQTVEEFDGAGKKKKKTVVNEGPLPPPQKGTRTTTTEYEIDAAGKEKKKKQTTVTKRRKEDGTFEEPETEEIEFDENGKPKKKPAAKLKRDAKGNVVGRTTTTIDFVDGVPATSVVREETYHPRTGTFQTESISLTCFWGEGAHKLRSAKTPARTARPAGQQQTRTARSRGTSNLAE